MEMWNLMELYAQKARLEALLCSQESENAVEYIQEKINEIEEEIKKIKK